ncbi:DNA cytosine methyltransferase [Thermoactinomyces sp. DSM 45892]|uniref:DNA cytosine methyltransferase n=1 Tax=Thermoactinomyces sp. DSM 45892 TaxID=1882753 RepID=UPI00089B7654|nr:DNA cytosine methyltransferase [Thermoactinomyces sp. DSM 45892]SDZ04854.1 DNA-methyltransferase (dcm) [Thermoactinomyces sp. DSM 45892]
MNYNVTPTLPQNDYTVAELFAGGGLMAIGLKESGFSILWANDFDKRASQSYAHNLGEHIICEDITKIGPDDIPDTDIIAGGPPCQDFSMAGKGLGEDGDRGKLVYTYLDIIQRKQPKAFIFENVKGLISKKHIRTFDALMEKFDDIGYNVSWELINSWDYGVAQKRERVFIVGIRKDLGFTFKFPEPDPKDYRTQVLRDVIGDLPDPNNHPKPLTDGVYQHAKQYGIGYNTSIDSPSKTVRTKGEDVLDVANHSPEEKVPKYVQNIIDGKSKSNFGKMPVNDGSTPVSTVLSSYYEKKPNEVYSPPNHNSLNPANVKKAQHKASMDKPSPSITTQFNCQTVDIQNHDQYDGRNYSPSYKNNNLKMEWGTPSNTISAQGPKFVHPDEPSDPPSNHNEKSYYFPKRESYKFNSANRQAPMDDPSVTITAHQNVGQPIHPTQSPRRFTVRECLRIQSVPDWYVIPEELSLSAQYKIVGNGVASKVAWYLGRALAEQLGALEEVKKVA